MRVVFSHKEREISMIETRALSPHQVFSYKAEVGSNWKLFIDAFAEFYHAPVLHQKQAVKQEADSCSATATKGCTTSCTAGTRCSPPGAAWHRPGT
jgi:phenylpropionate dioxygenase-like ring-hydroxylating dioxygenase large terminal subunit